MTNPIDMTDVFMGFALNYPTMAKIKTVRYGSLPPNDDNDFRNSRVSERINQAPESGLIIIQQSEVNQDYILDHYKLYFPEEMIGLHCTLPQLYERTKWEPYLAVCPKMIDIDNWQNEDPWNSRADRFIALPNSPCNYQYNQSMSWSYKLDWVGWYDLGGDMGNRQLIVLATNVPGTVKESWAWDLGGLYGMVAMRHDHLDGRWAVEVFSQLVDFNLQYEECGHILL